MICRLSLIFEHFNLPFLSLLCNDCKLWFFVLFCFQSSLKTAFTTVTHFKDIQTLEQLDQSGLLIGTTSGSLRKVFGSMENVFGAQNFSSSVIKSLKKKYILINSSNAAIDVVARNRNICCIERLTDSRIILSVRQTLATKSFYMWKKPNSKLFPKCYFSTNTEQTMVVLRCIQSRNAFDRSTWRISWRKDPLYTHRSATTFSGSLKAVWWHSGTNTSGMQ